MDPSLQQECLHCALEPHLQRPVSLHFSNPTLDCCSVTCIGHISTFEAAVCDSIGIPATSGHQTTICRLAMLLMHNLLLSQTDALISADAFPCGRRSRHSKMWQRLSSSMQHRPRRKRTCLCLRSGGGPTSGATRSAWLAWASHYHPFQVSAYSFICLLTCSPSQPNVHPPILCFWSFALTRLPALSPRQQRRNAW